MNIPEGAYMTVDPGIAEAGWVSWRGLAITGHGMLKSTKEYPWYIRAQELVQGLLAVRASTHSAMVACEMPQHMGSTARGRASAQDVVHLAYMVGFLGASLDPRVDWELLPVPTWKGNMDKDKVEKRVRRIMGAEVAELKRHEIDCAGMGLHIQGRFK